MKRINVWNIYVFWVIGAEGIHSVLFFMGAINLLQLESDVGVVRMQSQLLHIYNLLCVRRWH